VREIKHLSVHQWIRSAIPDSQQPTSPIGFLFLKLPPPPCAELLVILLSIDKTTISPTWSYLLELFAPTWLSWGHHLAWVYKNPTAIPSGKHSQFATLKMAQSKVRWFTHSKWWLSIVFCMFTRPGNHVHRKYHEPDVFRLWLTTAKSTSW